MIFLFFIRCHQLFYCPWPYHYSGSLVIYHSNSSATIRNAYLYLSVFTFSKPVKTVTTMKHMYTVRYPLKRVPVALQQTSNLVTRAVKWKTIAYANGASASPYLTYIHFLISRPITQTSFLSNLTPDCPRLHTLRLSFLFLLKDNQDNYWLVFVARSRTVKLPQWTRAAHLFISLLRRGKRKNEAVLF